MSDSATTIGKIARQAGTTPDSIRFYEREGLLEHPPRSHTGYRMYSADVVDRLLFIRKARHLGLSLEQIKEILGMATAGQAPCCRVRELLAEKLTALDQKIDELRLLRDEVQRFASSIADLPDQADASESVCVLIENAAVGAPRNSEGDS